MVAPKPVPTSSTTLRDRFREGQAGAHLQPRNAILWLVEGSFVWVVLSLRWDRDTAWQEVAALGVAALIAVVLVPMSEFLWAFITADWRIRVSAVAAERDALRNRVEMLNSVEAENATLRARLDERARRRAAAEDLARFMVIGEQLIAQVHEEGRRVPRGEGKEVGAAVEAWALEVEQYLIQSDLFGPSFVTRFRNHSGLPGGFTLLSPPYSHIEGYLKTRLARLEQFSEAIH